MAAVVNNNDFCGLGIVLYLSMPLCFGARFSKVPKFFRTRKAVPKSQTLRLQSCFFHITLISLVFFYLSKLLFSGFLLFKGKLSSWLNNSKCREWAPIREFTRVSHIMETTNFSLAIFLSTIAKLNLISG